MSARITIPGVIAHRGSSAAHPDNSWAAFEAAVAEGADAIECDVVATRDGVLAIRHDLAIGDRFVRELTGADLTALQPETILLSALLSWAEHTDIGLLVEVKEPDAALTVAAMVAESSLSARITVGGFHAPSLAAIKEAVPAVRTSLMMGSVVGADELVHIAHGYRVDGVHLCWEARATYPHRLIDQTFISTLRRGQLRVTLWHEEREDELRALVALEPDEICTDTPVALRRIVDAYRSMS